MVQHDDYMTPFSAWEDVSPYIPRHLTLWEAFYGDGTSGHHLAELGFDVIHEDVDFFTHDLGECVVTNPPFSELPRILARLRELGKPFVVIMPCSTLTTCYFRDLFQDIQVIVPRRRIQFRKLVDGVEVPSGRLPVFLLATRVAEGRGVLDVMAVSKSTEVGLRGDLQKINKISKIGAKLRPPYPLRCEHVRELH